MKKGYQIIEAAKTSNGRSRSCGKCNHRPCNESLGRLCSSQFLDGFVKGYKEAVADSKEDLLSIIHPATETPNRQTIYLFCLDPRSDEPLEMKQVRFLSNGVKPAECELDSDGVQVLPLFWITKKDFLKLLRYSEWAKEFEARSESYAWAAFPDYREYKKNRHAKRVKP